MELIWKIVLLCILERCLGDFFSDLDKLDIDSQLREIDDMLEKLDDDSDDSDDLLGSVSDTLDGLAGGPCKFKCKKGKQTNLFCFNANFVFNIRDLVVFIVILTV